MNRLVLALFWITAPSLAQTQLDLMPYTGRIDYSGTATKQNSTVAGVYAYYSKGGEHTLEGDLSWTRIKYDSAGLSRVDQTDLTACYTNTQILDWKGRIGLHHIRSDDDPTEGTVLFGGLHHYEPLSFSRGVDLYLSRYPDYTPALNVVQFTATWGKYLSQLQDSYLQVQGHYIRLDEEIGFDQKNFLSLGASLSYPWKSWTLQGFGWTGRQVFGVQKDGFVVYNLAEKHQGALGGSLQYAVNPTSRIKLEIAEEWFKELGYANSSKALKCILFWQHTF